MTDPDLKGFAELWQEPEADQQASFEVLAGRAKRRAQLLAYADLAFAVVLVASMILGFVLKPGLVSAAIAALIIAAILWLNWKRRTLRHMSRTLDTSDRHAFIASSVRNAVANHRRVLLSLVCFPILAVLAVLYKLSWRQGGRLEHPLDALGAWSVSTRGVIAIIGFAIIIAFMIRSLRKCRSELRRLDELKRDYQEAARLDDAGSD